MDDKCAPGKSFNEGSCINLETLKNIADNLNNEKNLDIDITKNKKDLVDELDKNFKNEFDCDNQLCWLNQSFVKRIKNEELSKYTFRPEGPNKKYDWLSTTNINDVIEQYENNISDFLFLGAVPYDFQELRQLELGEELNFDDVINGKINDNSKKHQKINKMGMVINLDPHYKSGSHWVALYNDFEKNQIYFFDSFGKKPKKKIKKFINKLTKYMYKKKYNKKLNINKLIGDLKNNNKSKEIENLLNFDIQYNNIQHQFENSECGVYSINFLIRLANGESFKDITNNITDDKKMNNCRKTYFRN